MLLLFRQIQCCAGCVQEVTSSQKITLTSSRVTQIPQDAPLPWLCYGDDVVLLFSKTAAPFVLCHSLQGVAEAVYSQAAKGYHMSC
jgi:hypothetical protein